MCDKTVHHWHKYYCYILLWEHCTVTHCYRTVTLTYLAHSYRTCSVVQFYYSIIYQQKCTSIFRFVEACLLYVLCFVLILRTVPSLLVAVLHRNMGLQPNYIWIRINGQMPRERLQYNNQGSMGTQNQHKTQVQKARSLRPKSLTETCRRIIRTFKQYNYFNVLFLIK